MEADELKTLRKELGVTARDLASALGVDQETVLAWERAELFPTKAHVEKLRALHRAGPSSVPKRAKKGASPLELLGDPAIWSLLRKLLVHDALRREVLRLAEKHPDPLDDVAP
jgi:transcriptional regulator with XRE-family HTH domain